MTLPLTPTRIELLRAVAADRVYFHRLYGANGKPDTPASIERCADHSERLRTAQMDLLEGAGYVVKGSATGPSIYNRRPWPLTDAGKIALEEVER